MHLFSISNTFGWPQNQIIIKILMIILIRIGIKQIWFDPMDRDNINKQQTIHKIIYLTNYFLNYFIFQFTMENEDSKRPQSNSSQSKYSKMLNNYTRTQFNTILPLLMVISRRCKYSSKYPIFKLLKVIAKTFILNQIQGIFFAYFIQETDWNIRQKILCLNAESVRDILSCSIEASQYKCIILYLMACAYTVKHYLNEDNSVYLNEASKICSNFKMIFEKWVKKHSQITTKISPKTLNTVFIELQGLQRKQDVDFNMIVDAIIQISPAYHSNEKVKQNESNHPIINDTKFQNKKIQNHQRFLPKGIVRSAEQGFEQVNHMNPFSIIPMKRLESDRDVNILNLENLEIPDNQPLRDSCLLFQTKSDQKKSQHGNTEIQSKQDQNNLISLGIKRVLSSIGNDQDNQQGCSRQKNSFKKQK